MIRQARIECVLQDDRFSGNCQLHGQSSARSSAKVVIFPLDMVMPKLSHLVRCSLEGKLTCLPMRSVTTVSPDIIIYSNEAFNMGPQSCCSPSGLDDSPVLVAACYPLVRRRLQSICLVLVAGSEQTNSIPNCAQLCKEES